MLDYILVVLILKWKVLRPLQQVAFFSMCCLCSCCKRSCQRQELSYYYSQSLRQTDTNVVPKGLDISVRKRVLESKMIIDDPDYKDHTFADTIASTLSTADTIPTHRMTSSLIIMETYGDGTRQSTDSTPSPSTRSIPTKSRCNFLRPLLSLPSFDNPIHIEPDSKGTTYRTTTPSHSQNIRNVNSSLNTMQMILYGLCHSFGYHIFVVSGYAANRYGGASSFASFTIGGITTAISTLCLCECNAQIPMINTAVHGLYPLFYITFGEVWVHWMAWNRILFHLCITAAGCIAVSEYFESILESLNLMQRLESDESLQILFGKRIHSLIEIHVIPSLVAVVIFSVFIKLRVHGQYARNLQKYRESEYVAVCLVILFLLLLIIGISLLIPWTSNVPNLWLKPCDDPNVGAISEIDRLQTECGRNEKNSFFPFGMKGFFACSAINMLCFDGMESLSKLSTSTTSRRVVTSVVTSSVISTAAIHIVFYSLLLMLVLSLIPFQSVDIHSTFSSLFVTVDCSLWIIISVAVCIMAVILFFEIRFVFKAPVLLQQLCADGLWIGYFGVLHTVHSIHSVHSSHSLPIRAILVMAVCTVIVAFCVEFTFLVETAAMMNAVGHLMVCAGTLLLRYSSSVHDRKSKEDAKGSICEESEDMQIDGQIKRLRSRDSRPRRFNQMNQWTHCSLQSIVLLFIAIWIVIGILVFYYDDITGSHLNIWTFLTVFLVVTALYLVGLLVYFHCSFHWRSWINVNSSLYIAPCFPLMPLIGIVLNVVMLTSMDWTVWSGIMLIYGAVLGMYYLCGYHGSKLSLRKRNSYLLDNVSVRYRLQSISSILGDVEHELTGTRTSSALPD